MRISVIPSAVARTTEQRRSSARLLLTTLSAAAFVIVLPLSVVYAADNDPPIAATTPPKTVPTPAPTVAPTTVPVKVLSIAPPPAPTRAPSPTDGLTKIAEGGAAFYAPGYDYGGWDAIISTHMRGGQGDPSTFPYSPEGYYCVHPDFVFGNVLTLQNPDTGKTIRCTVADAVAPGDQANWRSHVVIEMSYASFTALGLDRNNHVAVWAMTK